MYIKIRAIRSEGEDPERARQEWPIAAASSCDAGARPQTLSLSLSLRPSETWELAWALLEGHGHPHQRNPATKAINNLSPQTMNWSSHFFFLFFFFPFLVIFLPDGKMKWSRYIIGKPLKESNVWPHSSLSPQLENRNSTCAAAKYTAHSG